MVEIGQLGKQLCTSDSLKPVETYPVKHFRCQSAPKLTNFDHSPLNITVDHFLYHYYYATVK